MKFRIPKDGILAKVFWVDVTCHDKAADTRGRADMVHKCSVGILKNGNTEGECRIISEWDMEETGSKDSYEVILTKDAIDEIIPLVEKCGTKTKKKPGSKK